MVKRKRLVAQSNQEEKIEEGSIATAVVTDCSTREDAKATDNRIVGGGVSTVADPGTSSVMCGTRSRSQLIAGRLQEASPSIPADPEAKTVAVTPRSSARVSNKRSRKEAVANFPSTSNPQSSAKIKLQNAKTGKQIYTKKGQLRTRRSWELWSVEDKNAFFEALCEYGKDFENIQMHIAAKSKKRGTPPNMIKNKDQVRFFYYRTWHKISKYLEVGEDVKKPTLELYGLINYAEFRKKRGGCLNDKTSQKLNELVVHGVTTVKLKGKNLRIKTPVCRALKKLNNIEDTKEPEPPKLPKDIIVEFRPKTNSAWMRVQNMAQNPRVRTRIGLQKRLSTLVTYLERRWKPHTLRRKEKILESMPELVSPGASPEKIPNLRVYLQDNTTLCMLSVASVDSACSADVCLDNYMKGLAMNEQLQEMGKTKKVVRSKILPLNAIQNRISSSGDANVSVEKKDEKKPVDEVKQDDDSELEVNDLEESVLTNPETEAERSLSLLKNMIQSIDGTTGSVEDNKDKEDVSDTTVDKTDIETAMDDKVIENSCPVAIDLFLANQSENKNLTFGQFLSLNNEFEETKGQTLPCDSFKTNDVNDEKLKAEEFERIKKKEEELLSKIRKGWILEECRTLTIGQLYLMLNHPEKIILEYDFEISGDPQVKVVPDTGPEAVRIPQKMQAHPVAEILNRLISVASDYFTDFKNKQTPISPTNRAQTRTNVNPQSTKGSCANRSNIRNQGVRTGSNSKAKNNSVVNSGAAIVNGVDEGVISTVTPTVPCLPVTQNETPEREKHTFAMPVRAAPRLIKVNNQRHDSVIQDIDKLVAIQRNKHRARNRRPFVVPRPLLPSSVDNSGMTIVHLLPTSGPLTMTNVGGVKKIVLPSQQDLITKAQVGLAPVQILKPLSPAQGGLIFPAGNLTHTSVGVVVSACTNPSVIPTHTVTTIANAQSVISPTRGHPLKNTTRKQETLLSLSGSISNQAISINSVSLNVISPERKMQQTIGNMRITAGCGSSPPQISIPESGNSSSSLEMSSRSQNVQSSNFSPSICSLLDLSEGLNPIQTTEHLLDFNSNSSISSSFGISKSSSNIISPLIKKSRDNDPLVSNQIQVTPPLSPNGSRFKVNSPGAESNWLNGESSDFSLSSLLNTLESPVKNMPSCGPSDGSTLDAMSRLGPDVDTNLQCLINESSVDYVAKFADLAAQIASTASENKCS